MTFEYSPIFLGGMFKLTEDAPLPKGSLEYNYMARNLERFSKTFNIPFKFAHERFPINSLKALRGYYYAKEMGKDDEYIERVFESSWAKDEDITQVAVLDKIVESLGISGDEYFAFIEKDEVKQRLRQDTQSAFERGVFGTPSVFVGKELFWGTPGEILWNLSHLL
jgi:2-hydroxychromene-2-carboxylate isomerase